MIRKIKFSNFYSFLGEQEIIFVANKKQTPDYFKSKYGGDITKIAGFVGGNASGKTNVMRVFSFLGYFVCRRININEDPSYVPEIIYKTFFNNNDSSKFSIEFEYKGSLFFYNFEIKNNKILNEQLKIKSKKNKMKEIIFSRSLDKIKTLNPLFFKNISRKTFPKVRGDVSLIAFVKKSPYEVEVINDVYRYFSGFASNINEKGEINNVGHQISTLRIYLDDIDIKKEAEKIMCNFDLGLMGFNIKDELKDGGHKVSIQGLHKVKTENKKLDIQYESRGTQSLFFALAKILSALKHNHIVVIDEIEAGLHPEALNKLISYFIDMNENGKSQMIFSSHSLGFLNRLDMHQIFLVEKDDNNGSSTHRLNDVDKIRSDENFLGRYLSGAYGAFPKIRM